MGIENVSFPAGTSFLVTGAAGFIGSNLCHALVGLGYPVRGLDNFSTGLAKNIDELRSCPLFEFIEADIRDYAACEAACAGVDYVLHQAALGSVPRSVKFPLMYESNNISGTLNMMEASLGAGVKKFVYASSSSVYGDSTELPKREGREGNVLSPYALTKKANEEYGRLYARLYGLPCVGLRYFNVFGRRQDPGSQYAAVIPKFITTLLRGGRVEFYGDGSQSRDFTYIDNVVEANLKACLSGTETDGKAFNVAYGESYTLLRLYELMCGLLSIEREPEYLPERVGDVKHSLADISNAADAFGYSPSWSFEGGFRETVGWYTENWG